jgi:excisionase family DNA binding protein
LTRKETAEKLKISLPTLNDWSKRGLLKSYTIGGRVLYKANEIEQSLHQVKTVKY